MHGEPLAVSAPEQAPRVFLRVCTLLLRGLVHGYADVLRRGLRLLVHRVAVRVVRVRYPRVAHRPRHALLALNVAPLVVRRRVALQGAFLVVREAYERLARGVVRYAPTLSVVSVAYPRVKRLAVRPVLSGHARRSVFAVRAALHEQLILGGVHLPRQQVIPLLVRQPVALWVGQSPQRRVRRGDFGEEHRVAHLHHAHLGHGHSAFPLAAVGHALPLRALVHLQQPVGVAFRRLAVRAVLRHAQPYPPVVAHAVVVVVVPGLPRTPLIRRHHRRAVRLHLRHGAGEVHVVQVHRVPLHVHVELGQIAEVAVLQRHVPLRYLPRVLLPQHPRVRPRLVHRRLPAFVSKAAVADEIHHLKRVVSMRPSFACRAHLITELLVVVAYHFRYGEVNSAESGERPVAASVVSVRSGILGLGQRVVYSHADVAHGHSSYLAVLQFQRHGLSRGVHTFYDSAAWGAPLVAHLDVNPVVD